MAENSNPTFLNAQRSTFAKLIAFLSGKKTYLISTGVLVYAFGISRGWWPHQPEIDLMFGGAGAITIRAAIKKLCEQVSADPPFNSAPAEAARRMTAGPGVPAILLAASLFFLPGCSTQNTAAIAQHFARTPAGSAIVAKASNTVIDQGLNAGATRIDTGNPYLHAVADGIRANEGKILTAEDVQKIVTDYGDPANAHKFKTVAADVWQIIKLAAYRIGWSAAEELAAQTLQTSAADPTPPSP
jgi:hypothetical protein